MYLLLIMFFMLFSRTYSASVAPEIHKEWTRQYAVQYQLASCYDCYACYVNTNIVRFNYDSIRTLWRHCLKGHKEPFLCCPYPSCLTTFSTKALAKQHVVQEHDNRFFPCWLCNGEKAYKKKSDLVNHYRTVHLKMKFPCDRCSHEATQMSNLRAHQRKYCPGYEKIILKIKLFPLDEDENGGDSELEEASEEDEIEDDNVELDEDVEMVSKQSEEPALSVNKVGHNKCLATVYIPPIGPGD